jgi:hypothetical protein
MSVTSLLNVPKTKNDWDRFSFAHRTHHTTIRQAIFSQSNGADNLFEYQLDPIPANEETDWLARNQQSHDDFNQVLNLQGTDLQGVDFKDKKQLETWIQLHWKEHQNAAIALGI